MTTLTIVSTPVLSTVDELGLLKAQIADLKAKEEVLKTALVVGR